MSAARWLAASSLDPVSSRKESPAAIRATAANPMLRYRRTPNGRFDLPVPADSPMAMYS
jgi:hypothetical protein